MKKLLILCVGIATLAACKKNDDKDNKSKTEYLTSGKWYASSGTVTYSAMGIDTTVDLFASMDACDKDDFMEFKTNMSYLADEGATKCDPSDPQINETGTWAFSNNESQLTLMTTDNTTFFDTLTFNIKTLNSSTMELTQSETYGGVVYSYNMVYKH